MDGLSGLEFAVCRYFPRSLKFPSAMEAIGKDMDSLLTFFQFDATYWTVPRTANPVAFSHCLFVFPMQTTAL